MEITACPQPGCALPTEILDRMSIASTGGPLEHARLACLGGHRFFMPTHMLPVSLPPAGDQRVMQPADPPSSGR